MKQIKLFLVLFFLSLSNYSFCQQAVILSEIAPITGGTYIELYNAGSNSVNLSGCQISNYPDNYYTIPANSIIEPDSIFALVYSNDINTVKAAYPELNNSPNVRFISISYKGDAPIYFRNASSATLDYTYYSVFSRKSADIDENGNLSSGSGDFYGTGSFTPTLLKANIDIRRKRVLLYGYNASGNRTERKMNEIYLPAEKMSKTTQDPMEQSLLEGISIEIPNARPVNIYPNPTTGNINIGIEETDKVSYQYKLYNLSGNLLQEGNIRNTGEHSIEMGEYRNGTYILMIEGSSIKETIKIIKE